MVYVSWEDAQAFCAWLSRKEGKTYRLPTDKEWSIAVGIGREERWGNDTTPATVQQSQTEFLWGDKWPPPKGAGNYSDQSRKAKAPNGATHYPETAPVMSYKPNKLGLYDMGGNVWEWVKDWYSVAKTDRALQVYSRVNYDYAGLLSSSCGRCAPGLRNHNHNDIGIRVVCVAALATRARPILLFHDDDRFLVVLEAIDEVRIVRRRDDVDVVLLRDVAHHLLEDARMHAPVDVLQKEDGWRLLLVNDG